MELTSNSSNQPNKKYRLESNRKIIDFENSAQSLGSYRKAAKETGIARSTYQHLNAREKRFEMGEDTERFFRTSDGVNFLHRLTLAIEFVLSQICGAGITAIQRVYELSQLDRIIACSDGSLCERLKTLETHITAFGDKQFEHLGEKMPEKSITCALDETFPSGICLVGIDASSNFILTEEFADKRDSATWQQAMSGKLKPLPVTVVQVVSDEAKALLKYCQDHLKANHSPDLFHVQQEISKATSAPMRAKIKQVQSYYDQSTQDLQGLWDEKVTIEALEVKPIGRPVDYESWLDDYSLVHSNSLEQLIQATKRHEEIKEANKGIGDDYHPYDLNDGTVKTAKMLESELNQRFEVIQTHATSAELSENSFKKINKAKKVTASMIATLNFFWSWMSTEIERVKLNEIGAEVFKKTLVLLAYLELHIPKSRNAKQKNKRKQLYDAQMDELESYPWWQSLDALSKQDLMDSAKKCAEIFQRSSSCVEGRNGQLSLMHHSTRTLSSRKLSSLTVIHNYFIKRDDGTTAAERFFEQKHENLFLWLLDRVDCPPLPAKKREYIKGIKKVA